MEKEKMFEKINDYLKRIFVVIVLAVLCYLPLIANSYNNSFDGLWHPTHKQAGNWELSIGRWAWLFLDKMRDGYAAEPLNSLLTLFFISTAMTILFYNYKRKSYIFILLFVISTVTCCFLSYRYMSPTFGLSVLLPVIAAKLTIEKLENQLKFHQSLIWLLIIGLMTVTLGLYQANIGCYCIIVLFAALKYVYDDKFEYSLKLIFRAIVMFAISCILYKIIWDIALKLRHVEAAGYKGADDITITRILLNIPYGIRNAYVMYIHNFIYPDSCYLFSPIRLLIIILLLIILIALPIFNKLSIKNIIIYEFIVLLMPIACCVCYLLTPDAEGLQMQMTAPLVLFISLILAFISEKTKSLLIAVAGCLLLYGNIYSVGVDIDALALGTASCNTIMSSIVNYIIGEDLYSDTYKYAFIGEISDSPLFKVNENWTNSSYYAHFGYMLTAPSGLYDSYNGLIDDMGLNGFYLLSAEEYEKLIDNKDIEDMPCFPNKGSIVKKGDTVVIKVSNHYK